MILFGSFVFVLIGLVKNGVGEVVVIGKPEFQCGENGEVIELGSNVTKIRLPENASAWFSVNAVRSSRCPVSQRQRCTLIKWRIIRDFESYLNRNYNNIGSKGIICFRNDIVSKVIPGFNYLLHVMLKTNDKLQEADFNITFFNDDENNGSTTQVYGELELEIGTNRIDSPLPIIINANIVLCGNVVYYYFKWSIIINNQEHILPEKSSKLSILPPSDLFDKGDWCVIQCKVMDYENNTVLLEKSTRLNIHKTTEQEEELEVFLPFKYSTFSKGVPISIVPYVDARNMDYKTEWSCMFQNASLYGCQGQSNDAFYMLAGFSQEGNYSITLTVRTFKMEKAATCNIFIRSDVPSIELHLVYPIWPERGVEVEAKLYDIRTYCNVQWVVAQDNQYELIYIPELTDTYNISSRDLSFLEEMMELGGITATKHIKLKIPPPSRTWSGLKSGNYIIELAVACPSLQEINDMSQIEDQPSDFVTISAQTIIFIRPSPTVGSVEVVSQYNKALSSEYNYYVVHVEGKPASMVYKYGFVLDEVEVVFYTGIDVFRAKTTLPFNGDAGIETFVEVCDYRDRCGKTFGPIVTPSINNDLAQNKILKALKQHLIEEDFYAAFSYAFIVLHSTDYLNQSQMYRSLFSSQFLTKVNELLEQDADRLIVNNFIKNFLLFADHLEVSDELIIHLCHFTNFEHTSSRLPRAASGRTSPQAEDLEKLEDIEYYMAISEYSILNLISNEAVETEKEHMLNLLDRWMTQACAMIFKGQHVRNVEMTTLLFSIERISERIINNFIVVPFSGNAWNVITRLKIGDITSDVNLCVGRVALKYFFGQECVTFGANIYSGEGRGDDTDVSTNITVFVPKREGSNLSQCSVYRNGRNLDCSTAEEHANFVECICPTFGYYFLNARNGSLPEGNWDTLNITEISNITNEDILKENSRRIGEQIFYVIIVSSLGGFGILCYIIKKLTIFPQQNMVLDGFSDTYNYGHVMNDDF